MKVQEFQVVKENPDHQTIIMKYVTKSEAPSMCFENHYHADDKNFSMKIHQDSPVEHNTNIRYQDVDEDNMLCSKSHSDTVIASPADNDIHKTSSSILHSCVTSDTESETSNDSSCQGLPRPLNLMDTTPRVTEIFVNESVSSCVSIIKMHSSDYSGTKHVSFGDVTIRKFVRILGDHPDVSVGPPVSIGWDYNSQKPMSADKYESKRTHRRHNTELILSNTTRRRILEHLTDATEEDINRSINEVNKIRLQRQQTLSKLSFSKEKSLCCSLVST